MVGLIEPFLIRNLVLLADGIIEGLLCGPRQSVGVVAGFPFLRLFTLSVDYQIHRSSFPLLLHPQ